MAVDAVSTVPTNINIIVNTVFKRHRDSLLRIR